MNPSLVRAGDSSEPLVFFLSLKFGGRLFEHLYHSISEEILVP